MPAKEATARIKINRLLEAAGWRFFDDANGRANIALASAASVVMLLTVIAVVAPLFYIRSRRAAQRGAG